MGNSDFKCHEFLDGYISLSLSVGIVFVGSAAALCLSHGRNY